MSSNSPFVRKLAQELSKDEREVSKAWKKAKEMTAEVYGIDEEDFEDRHYHHSVQTAKTILGVREKVNPLAFLNSKLDPAEFVETVASGDFSGQVPASADGGYEDEDDVLQQIRHKRNDDDDEEEGDGMHRTLATDPPPQPSREQQSRQKGEGEESDSIFDEGEIQRATPSSKTQSPLLDSEGSADNDDDGFNLNELAALEGEGVDGDPVSFASGDRGGGGDFMDELSNLESKNTTAGQVGIGEGVNVSLSDLNQSLESASVQESGSSTGGSASDD